MKPLLLLALACAAPSFALAQTHDHHAGHTAAPAPAPAPAPSAEDPHAHHHAPAPAQAEAADPHAGHGAAEPADDRAGADLPVGSATPPPPAKDHAADRVWGGRMDRARDVLALEHGGMRTFAGELELFELRPGGGSDVYAWEGELSYGGDSDRLLLRSEGEGELDHKLEHAEVQALWSHAVTPYFDLTAGLRQDLQPLGRTYAAVGFEGLAPYWIDVQGALFVSHRGVVSARLEGSWDMRLTQRLILEPKFETDLAADDDRAVGLGSGLQAAEVGLRLRYEVRREFAPYVGVHYRRSFGETADLGRAAGEDIEQTRAVVGLQAAF